MGEDGALLSWQAHRSRPHRERWAIVFGGDLVDRAHGSPWRDLPPARLRQVEHRVFKRMFDAVSDDPDMEYAMIDATIVKVHRHGQGAKGGLRARP